MGRRVRTEAGALPVTPDAARSDGRRGADAAAIDVTGVVSRFLAIDSSAMDPDRPLVLYGLDSLTSVELVAALERATGRSLPEWLLLDHPTVNELIRALADPDAPRAAVDFDAMRADAALPPDVRPDVAGAPADPPDHVLLTGATGFLGAYLLRALIDDTRATVSCLVRAADGRAQERVRRNLERYGIWRESMTDRLRFVSGDVAAPRLGASQDEYRALADTTDAIHHVAADVDWSLPYASLRDVNVLGTLELVRLACRSRPKSFRFVSSLSVAYAVDGPATVDEDSDAMQFLDRLPLGYAQSKAVAESLVRQAAARGLSATIHRPPFITGDSATGASNVDDFIAALVKGCILMRAAPDLDWTVDALPVDYVAQTLLRLPGRGAGALRTFQLSNRRPRHWRECVLWMNLFGYPCALVPYRAWRDRLDLESRSPDHPLHALRGFFLREHAGGRSAAELYEDGRRSRIDASRTHALESAAGLDAPRLTADLLDAYFQDYLRRGFLPSPPRRHAATVARSDDDRPAPDDPRRLERLLRTHFRDPSLNVIDATRLSIGSEHSILGELTAWRHGRRVGLFECRLTIGRDGARAPLDVVVKAKAADTEVMDVGQTVADLCGGALGEAFRAHRSHLGIEGGHVREGALYEMADARISAFLPVSYGVWRDDERRDWGIVLERLRGMEAMDAADDPAAWTPRRVDAAIDGLAELHAGWAPHADRLATRPWLARVPSLESRRESAPLWRALAEHAAPYFARWAGPRLVATHRDLVESVESWWPALDASPRTLIHHDFNPRNVALRRVGEELRLCAYDWEMATLGAPQRDLAEFLCFVAPVDAPAAAVARWVERHRAALAAALGRPIDSETWRAGFAAALADLLVSRLSVYAMIDRVRPQPFLPRVVRTWGLLFERSATGLPR